MEISLVTRFLAPVFAAAALLVFAPAHADTTAPASRSPADVYRAYASEQAEMLVRMTRVLARDIRDGNVEAAQNEYASTHRYLERIRPLVRQRPDLERRLDAGDDGIGFRRIERALYVVHSTAGLAPTADRLNADARQLQQEVATLPIGWDLFVDGPAATIDDVSLRVLSGATAPYAKTGLWDLEAGLDDAQAMVAALKPRDPLLATHIASAFADATKVLAEMSEGCGYKSLDSLSEADKSRLRVATRSLSRQLAKLKTTTAID